MHMHMCKCSIGAHVLGVCLYSTCMYTHENAGCTHFDLYPKTFDTTPHQEVDDFAVAQSTPLPKCIAGIEGDEV